MAAPCTRAQGEVWSYDTMICCYCFSLKCILFGFGGGGASLHQSHRGIRSANHSSRQEAMPFNSDSGHRRWLDTLVLLEPSDPYSTAAWQWHDILLGVSPWFATCRLSENISYFGDNIDQKQLTSEPICRRFSATQTLLSYTNSDITERCRTRRNHASIPLPFFASRCQGITSSYIAKLTQE